MTELGVAYADKVLRVYERGLVFARNGAYKLEFDQETIDSELAKTISYDLDQMYAFLESEQSINFLGKCENFPLAYDRARELFGKNANKLDAQDKKTPALLNLLAGVPQETYQKNLSVIKQYSFLYPPVAEGTFIEFSTPYIEILMNGITESEQMTFNAVMKIGKILGDKKLVGHPIVSKGPKEILASEEDILNELETLEVLIYSLKDNPDLLAAVMEDPSTVYSNLKSLRGVAFWQDFVAILVKLSADGWGVNVEDAYDLLKADRSGKNRVDSICGNIRKSNWANSRLFDAEQREYWLFLQDIRSQERAEQNIISIDEVAMLQSFIRPDTSNLFFNITEIIIRNTEDPFQRKDVFNLLCEQKDGLGFGIHVDEVSAYLDSIDEKTADEVDARFIKVWQHCQNKGILNVVFFPEFLFSVMNRVDELFDANNEPLYLLYFEFLQYVKSLPLDSTSLFKTIQDTVLSKEEPFTELSKLVTDNVDTQFLENLQLYVRVIEIFKEENIKDWKNYHIQFFDYLLQVDDKEEVLADIKTVLANSDIPDFAKIYRVFERVYLQEGVSSYGSRFITQAPDGLSDVVVSPELEKASQRKKAFLLYTDLLRIHVDSNNDSLRAYLRLFSEVQQLIDTLETDGVVSLGEKDKLQLFRVFSKYDGLFGQTKLPQFEFDLGTINPEEIDDILILSLQKLYAQFAVPDGMRLSDRVTEIFARTLGVSSIEELLNRMDTVTKESDTKNRARVEQGSFSFETGDLCTSVNVDECAEILEDGLTAPEFLKEKIARNHLLFSLELLSIGNIEDRDQKQISADLQQELQLGKNDVALVFTEINQVVSDESATKSRAKHEVFDIEQAVGIGSVFGRKGVRTGLSSSELSAILVTPSMRENGQKMYQLFYNIAIRDRFVPVIDMASGECILTEEIFDALRVKNELILEVVSGNPTPEELIAAFKESFFLKKLYDAPAYVLEGISLEQHTITVLRQFMRYFFESDLGVLSKDEFLVLFALHDIGKPLAKVIAGTSTAQHIFTQALVTPLLMRMGFDQLTVDTIISIASQDILGLYMQGKIELQDAAKRIVDLSFELGLDINKLLKTLKVYYLCDASSYTQDALDVYGKKGFLNHLFKFDREKDAETGTLALESQQEVKLFELENEIRNVLQSK